MVFPPPTDSSFKSSSHSKVSLNGAGAEPQVDVGKLRQFTVTSQAPYPASAVCTVTIKGSFEEKATVSAKDGSFVVTYRLDKPGNYLITVSVDGSVATQAVRSNPVVLELDKVDNKLLKMRLDGDQFGLISQQFNSSQQVAVSADLLLFIAERDTKRVQVLDWDGNFKRSISVHGCDGIVLDAGGLLYVSDWKSDVVRVLRRDGAVVRTCDVAASRLSSPWQLCVDRGVMYITNRERTSVDMFNEDAKAVGRWDVGHSVQALCVDERATVYTAHGAGGVKAWSAKRKLLRTFTPAELKIDGAAAVFVNENRLYVANGKAFSSDFAVVDLSHGSVLHQPTRVPIDTVDISYGSAGGLSFKSACHCVFSSRFIPTAVVLLGAGRVGKTSLCLRYVSNSFSDFQV